MISNIGGIGLLDALAKIGSETPGHFEQALPFGLGLKVDNFKHETDVRVDSYGDTLAHLHTGHNPSLTLFGDGYGPESVHAVFATQGSESFLGVFSGYQDIVEFHGGANPSFDVLDLLDGGQFF